MAQESKPPNVEIEHQGTVARVKIQGGTIDESFGRDSFKSLAGRSAPVVFDLDEVTRITSFGVREWMLALRELDGPYFFVKCRPAIFAQFNTVNGFGGQGQVVTFYCPYVCPECDAAFDVLLDLRRQRDLVEAFSAPQAKCPTCGADAEFDDIEASYFGRAATWPPVVLSPLVEAVVDGKAAPIEPLLVEKTIEGDLTVLWLSGGMDKAARLKRHVDGLEGVALVLLHGLRNVTPGGLKNLDPLLDLQTADVFLARVPIDLVRLFAESPRGIGRATLSSVIVRASCSACSFPVELDASSWGEAPPAEASVCPRCQQAAVSPLWTAADAAAVKKLGIDALPEVALPYLRADAPSPSSGGSRSGDEGSGPVPRGNNLTLGPGARVGKYEVIRRIGMGGMAEVLLGRQLGLEGFQKKVVIKRILPHLASQPQFVQMFLQEARVAARLLHSNIVQIYDLVREGEDYFAIMEYVRGADLNVVLKLANRLDVDVPIELACRIVADVCGALEAAHTYADDDGRLQPVLHRDVSPHNVLVSTDGVVKLTDFGVAKAADSLHQTSTGNLKGKVIYMAPEHVLGQPSDHRVDVFAAGLVLYTCLAQQNPFMRATELMSLKAVLDAPIPRVDELRKDCPPALADIVARATERDPSLRYPTAAAMQEDIEVFLSTFGKPASSAQLSAWLKAFLARSKDMDAMAKNLFVTPSGEMRSTDQMQTTVTTPERLTPVNIRAKIAGAASPLEDDGALPWAADPGDDD